MRIEILDNQGQVVQTIVASAEFAEQQYPSRWREVAEAAVAAPVVRHVTKLSFRNRFTQSEKIALELAAIDNPTGAGAQRQQSAALRANLADQRDATFIDLERPDTRAGVLALEAAGLLSEGRALQILDDPVQPEEAYRG